jgi:hypothetical protein
MRRLGASQLFGEAAGTHVRNYATHLFSTEAPYKCAQLTRILLCKLFILNRNVEVVGVEPRQAI